MAREVVWTETAWRDLERIAEYIAEDSPGYAATLMRQVRDTARSLDQLTERGRVVPELDDLSVRELLVGSYRLIYEVADQRVFVLGVIHGARDLDALWIREDRG